MTRYLGIINYSKDISNIDYIEKSYDSLKNNFNIRQDLNLYKTRNISLSNGFLNISFGEDKYIIMYDAIFSNINEIKRTLSNKGYTFTTKTKLKKERIIPLNSIEKYLEAEIILSCYHEYKEDFLKYIEGIFSICIYDKKRDMIFLSIDRIGSKSIFYTKSNLDNCFIFSTNTAEILNMPNIENKKISDNNISIESKSTNYENIYKLLPGHYAIYSNFGLITHNYNENKNDAITNELITK